MTDRAQDKRSQASVRPRELRLDFFRGLALFFIFLDHIPSNTLNWLTIRNYGFSDASEAFVFIAGYSAVLAYGRRLTENGFVFVTARVYKRCWQLYVAQLLLFMAFTAQVAYTAATFNNPMYSEEMGIVNFFDAPHVSLLQAMLLRFRPTNMDILPLYIVLLSSFPFILLGLKHCRALLLLSSVLAYGAANLFGWNLTTWPDGSWPFNPLAWQILFVGGAWAGVAHGTPWMKSGRRIGGTVAVLYLLFSLLVVLTWHIPSLEVYLPDTVETILYPINKANLSPFRLIHFLALAYVIILATPGNSRIFRWTAIQPVIRCGQHPLEIFCLGIFLSFAGHMLLVELCDSLAAQAGVSVAGIAVMIAAAYYLTWYRKLEKTVAMTRGSDTGTAERDGPR
ncbi:OpgC domain-containing protein [Telmatospirillum sp.]|uniref:OpgC family protein n=1 Tax=Telmatospirillum sp. TaxID=2079197 RepID=UPI0028413DD9|nr:OpgC domain-containing protein [Telmatospirillum sp.]MDR3439656.1 OpgC domain-containing protein [Telmatospirillum sp.]